MRYILFSGYVSSLNDGDRHYVKACNLITYYKLPRGMISMLLNPTDYIYEEGDIVLHPDSSGEYDLEKVRV